MRVLSKTDEIAKALIEGQTGILPTDTVYGLVCVANNPSVANKINELKKRENKPGTIIASSVDQLVELGITRRYLTAVTQYWPGAVSVIIPCGSDLDYLHLGKRSLAVRIPDSELLSPILTQTGALLTSSANIAGKPVATNIQEAWDYFGDSVDFYVDGGEIQNHKPSTIIQVIDDYVEVVRQGAVNIPNAGK